MVDGVPVSLGRYEVHPRSIGMVRAEEMRTFSGAIRMQHGKQPDEWVLDNQSEWELWDCQLITANEKIPVGDVHAGDRVEISARAASREAAQDEPSLYNVHRSIDKDSAGPGRSVVAELGELSQTLMLELCGQQELGLGLRDSVDRPRLVGWAPRSVPGQQIKPDQDRSVGFTVFVVHL
jgi:hypothetical protein